MLPIFEVEKCKSTERFEVKSHLFFFFTNGQGNDAINLDPSDHLITVTTRECFRVPDSLLLKLCLFQSVVCGKLMGKF
jgi:hypothetical protein